MKKNSLEFKALMNLIHDHNSNTGLILYWSKHIPELIDKGSIDEAKKYLSKIYDWAKAAQDNIDRYYKVIEEYERRKTEDTETSTGSS